MTIHIFNMWKAVDMTGRAFLCGMCDTDDAYVVVSDQNRGLYGHCALCEHTVYLGAYSTKWQRGGPMAVVA